MWQLLTGLVMGIAIGYLLGGYVVTETIAAILADSVKNTLNPEESLRKLLELLD